MSLWSLPTPSTAALLVPGGVMIAAVMGRLAAHLHDRLAWRVGSTRKVFHFAIFTLAAAVSWRGGMGATQAFGGGVAAVVLYAAALGGRSGLYRALARPSDAPQETLHVLLPLAMTAVGGLASSLLFGELAVVGFLVTGWGDAVGEPVGLRWGRNRYTTPTLWSRQCHRSLEGSAAVLVASFVAALIALAALVPSGLSVLALRAGVVALASTLTEAISVHSLDNFSVQVVAAGVAAAMAC